MPVLATLEGKVAPKNGRGWARQTHPEIPTPPNMENAPTLTRSTPTAGGNFLGRAWNGPPSQRPSQGGGLLKPSRCNSLHQHQHQCDRTVQTGSGGMRMCVWKPQASLCFRTLGRAGCKPFCRGRNPRSAQTVTILFGTPHPVEPTQTPPT